MDTFMKLAGVPFVALVAGLVLAWVGVQYHKVARRNKGLPKRPNLAQQKIAFWYGLAGSSLCLIQFKAAAAGSYSLPIVHWVSAIILGVFTGFCAPTIWGWVMSYLKVKYPGMYDMLRVKYQDSRKAVDADGNVDPLDHTDMTWFGRWDGDKIVVDKKKEDEENKS